MPYLKRNGQLSRESEERGRLALLADHDVYQCGNTCDVAAAYRRGLLSVTAHLLYGATKSEPLGFTTRESADGPEGTEGARTARIVP